MPKVRESSLAEIQRDPFLHGRWVSAVGGSGFLQRASAAGVGVHVTTLGGWQELWGVCKTEVGYLQCRFFICRSAKLCNLNLIVILR